VFIVCDSEVILTLGRSKTVKEFLCAAKEKKRSFRVFVAEGAPRFVRYWSFFIVQSIFVHNSCLTRCGNDVAQIRYQGHSLAKELVEKGIQTTVITDSAVFAMISRVNMVPV
jgi:translation initiation factor eIF-2B subunit beta